jgi:folate-dependent phosphoribosylglycinamide formyltransferase PurN
MFGDRVHAAVLQAGEKESGCTVHYVDESVDGGPIILQSRVPIESGDDPHTLSHRILVQEHRTYAKALQLHADGKIRIANGRATIDRSGGWEDEWNQRQAIYTIAERPVNMIRGTKNA